jgi:signal transduction histidine kinase
MEPKHTRPERADTDESLRAEREKTDTTFARQRGPIERQADAVVELARDRADTVLAGARKKADLLLQEGPASIEKGIRVERASADETLDRERATADSAVDEERVNRAHALAWLVKVEREETDEHLLAERARSDEVVASRDDFLGMVSHDAGNMLSGIAMSAAWLTRTQTDQRTLQEARRITRLTASVNRLISDLLDVVSMESGKLSVAAVEGDAAQLLGETLEAFRAPAAAKAITLTTEVMPRSSAAYFDRERVLQVLTNLVGNALKFTDPGGHIHVRMQPFEDEIRFSVEDDGRGIAADQLEAIFERFWQVGRRHRSGLGLGLYISRCIVAAHGGSIWAESELGNGSAFHFTLPRTAGWGTSPGSSTTCST